ncbi:MAG: permease-like cell division protein FtsX [Synergistaceae bacterium]|nr:permease-like cell division protein FtsX [Synergistaceae bacterium]
MQKLRYAFRDATRLLTRQWGMTIFTLLTSFCVFAIVGATWLFASNVKNIFDSMEEGVSVQAYLKNGVNLAVARTRVENLPGVSHVNLVSKADALERLRSRLGDQSEAITLVGDNPLPESIEVYATDSELVPSIVEKLRSMNEVDDVIYAGDLVKRLARVSKFLDTLSLSMIVMALVACSLILFNTIRLTAYSHTNEINMMVRVGATSGYVIAPFVISGAILGGLSAIIASVALSLSYLNLINILKAFMPFFAFIDSSQFVVELSWKLILGGTLVSFFASLIAVCDFVYKANKRQ